MTEQKRLPWTGEFSAGKLGPELLIEALRIVKGHEGDRQAIKAAFRDRWLGDAVASRANDPRKRLIEQLNLANNIVIGMSWYGLVDLQTTTLTDLGNELLGEPSDEARFETFARHILRNCYGAELLDAVRKVKARNSKTTLANLREQLKADGFEVGVNNSDHSKMRQWLEQADVIDSDWSINEARVGEILGLQLDTIDQWRLLNRAERAFLRTLHRVGTIRGKVPIDSRELREFVSTEHGPVYDEARLADVYRKLHEQGWAEHNLNKSGSSAKRGRGGKGGYLTPTDKLLALDLDFINDFDPGDLPADLRHALGKPIDEIYRDLDSQESHTKGLALELLAVNLASDLGLAPVRLRVRGTTTGGAEVDLLAEGSHLLFSRWLFQCKATRTVNVGVLSKEVGMATLMHAHVIVLVTTGTFTGTVRKYARRTNETTPFQVVLVDGETLKEYAGRGHRDSSSLREFFQGTAGDTLQAKRPQVVEVLDELGADDGG